MSNKVQVKIAGLRKKLNRANKENTAAFARLQQLLHLESGIPDEYITAGFMDQIDRADADYSTSLQRVRACQTNLKNLKG